MSVDSECVEPDVHTAPEQAHTTPVPVERRADALCLAIGKKIDNDTEPARRYEQYVYWRSVLELAAVEMTVHAGYALRELQDSGLSSRKISGVLAEAGIRLSPSGVELAIGRTKNPS